MATLQYEKWEKKENALILTGKSIGNHSYFTFTDTLTIEKLTADELVVKNRNQIIKYNKK